MIERYRGNLAQIFAWSAAMGLRQDSPFVGVGMSKRAKTARRAAGPGPARRAWIPAQLRTLFAHPRDPRNTAAPLWRVPRIAAGSEMRMGGGAVAARGDFRGDGAGGWLVVVRHGKTESARPDIPMHSALVEVGLVALALGCGGVPLFADLERDPARGTCRRASRGRFRGASSGWSRAGWTSTACAGRRTRRWRAHHGAPVHPRTRASAALADGAYLRAGPAWAAAGGRGDKQESRSMKPSSPPVLTPPACRAGYPRRQRRPVVEVERRRGVATGPAAAARGGFRLPRRAGWL